MTRYYELKSKNYNEADEHKAKKMYCVVWEGYHEDATAIIDEQEIRETFHLTNEYSYDESLAKFESLEIGDSMRFSGPCDMVHLMRVGNQ